MLWSRVACAVCIRVLYSRSAWFESAAQCLRGVASVAAAPFSAARRRAVRAQFAALSRRTPQPTVHTLSATWNSRRHRRRARTEQARSHGGGTVILAPCSSSACATQGPRRRRSRTAQGCMHYRRRADSGGGSAQHLLGLCAAGNGTEKELLSMAVTLTQRSSSASNFLSVTTPKHEPNSAFTCVFSLARPSGRSLESQSLDAGTGS